MMPLKNALTNAYFRVYEEANNNELSVSHWYETRLHFTVIAGNKIVQEERVKRMYATASAAGLRKLKMLCHVYLSICSGKLPAITAWSNVEEATQI